MKMGGARKYDIQWDDPELKGERLQVLSHVQILASSVHPCISMWAWDHVETQEKGQDEALRERGGELNRAHAMLVEGGRLSMTDLSRDKGQGTRGRGTKTKCV